MSTKVHNTWENIQNILQNCPPHNFVRHPVINKWLLRTGGLSSAELLDAARTEDPAAFESIFLNLEKGSIFAWASTNLSSINKIVLLLYYLMRIRGKFPDSKNFKILEIGGGFGILASIFATLNMCREYHIVDISVIQSIQKYFLTECLNQEEQKKINLFNIEKEDDHRVISNINYDLIISTFALTETPKAMQNIYVESMICKSKYIYIIGQRSFKGERVDQHIFDSLQKYFLLETSEYKFSSQSRPSFELFGINRCLIIKHQSEFETEL